MIRFARTLSAVVFALVLAGCTGTQTPSTPPVSPPEVTPSAPTLPEPAEPLPLAKLAAFSAVAEMNAGSNCTGTLIDTGVPSGPAYILTNGHCVGDVGRSAQATTVSIEWGGTATFLAAQGNRDNLLSVDVVGLEYSTMRHTDTAIVRLKPTLGELVELGIRPVPITADEPDAGAAVVNVGVPVQNLYPDDWVLRRGECKLGSQQTLLESGWLWFGAWSNDCPGIIQGSSGSPLFSVDADGNPTRIVAMINTTTWGGTPVGACTINHPCEVSDGGVRMQEQTSYAQSVAGLAGCFGADGKFALGEGCPLPNSSVWNEFGGGSFRGGDLPNFAGDLPAVNLVGRAEGSVRTALVPLGDARACQHPETYLDAAATALPKAGEEWERVGVNIPVKLPEQEGRFLFCAVAGEDYPGAASVLFDVDRTPPTIPAGAEIEDIGGGAVVVRPVIHPPEITSVRFTWGAPNTVDCDNTEGFQEFFIVPLTLERGDLPVKYCVYGMDTAGNRTDVTRIDIPRR